MSIYLHDIPLDEAKEKFRSTLDEYGLFRILGKESIPLNERAVGRVLFAPILAKISSPHYHASAMDGYAVRAEKTVDAQPAFPITLSVGDITQISCDAIYVDTGDPVPVGFNAVIPIEHIEPIDELGKISSTKKPRQIRIRSGVTPWSNIRPLGEDIVISQLILTAGHIIRPIDLGAIAAAGYKNIVVTRKPRVAIIPTGTELVPIGSNLNPGDIIEYNSLILASQVNEWGGRATRFPITPDNYSQISSRVIEAAKRHHLILLNAGSSAGSEDFSAEIVKKLGRLLIHGVAVRPGHPVILGMIKRRIYQSTHSIQGDTTFTDREEWVPIIGVPGYPVSAALISELFVEPLIAKWIGRHQLETHIEQARITRKITSPPGNDDFIRVSLGKVGNQIQAIPLSRGAGVISSLVYADGLLHLPSGIQGIESGQIVDVSLFRQRELLDRTILCVGSHDMTLELLSRFIAKQNNRLVSINVGSQGGLLAINRGEAHLAGSHLLDPETGQYNVSYIQKYITTKKVKIFGFVDREQGLMVRRGNPKKIRDLVDLSRDDITYMNRQRGAGTRVLLDHLLKKIDLPTGNISGYDNEEYTHLGVAAAIASGRADCGMGIHAAARALDLDFIPIVKEKYQLIIPTSYLELELLKSLFDVLFSKEFRKAVYRLPGYRISEMGDLISEIG